MTKSLSGYDSILDELSSHSSSLADITQVTGVLIENYPRIVPENDDSGRFNRTLAALPNSKGIIGVAGNTYTFSSINTIPLGVHIIGVGMDITIINHTGNNIGFDFIGGNFSDRGSIQNLTVIGNSGASAIGIEISDQLGFLFHKVKVRDYTSGIGVRWNNKSYWTEGTIVEDLAILNCAVGLRLERNGGTNSFAYTRCSNLLINVPNSGIGVDFGGVSGQSIYMYHAIFNCTIWLDNSTNAIAIQGRSGTNIEHSDLFISGEGNNITGQKSLVLGGATIKGKGFFRIFNSTMDTSSGSIRLINPDGISSIDNMGGTDGNGNVYHSFSHQNVDSDTFAQIGYFTQNNVNSPFVSMYKYGGNSFKVKSVASGQSVSQGTDVFSVDMNGNGNFAWGVNGGAFTTTNRPTYVTQGTCIFDTTLNKPVWAKVGGATPTWVDATGATV